ncbi:MAG: hypothetical protein WDA16_12970 [Candidatus Thermoplasmatota archaeon]
MPAIESTEAIDDPQLRAAVLDLFRANDAFRMAYDDFARSQGRDHRALEALADAETRIDLARGRVMQAQDR